MKPDFDSASKAELIAWIDYLETKVERLETHIDYLMNVKHDPKASFNEEPCYCNDCLGIF